ncbi:MAG TPA: hypothetical protein VGI06_04825, partial [Acidimicrobiales bacterium]
DLVVTVAELALGVVLIARWGAGLSGTPAVVGAIAMLDGVLELGRSFAPDHPDRAEVFVVTDTR